MNSTIIFPKYIETQFQLCLQDQRQGEICLTFYKEYNKFMWYDKPTMTTNMKMWRKLAKKVR